MQTLSKEERLCGSENFSDVFEKGIFFYQTPFKVFKYKCIFESKYSCRTSFVVSKKLFKNASTRNLLRRRMKEAFRKNKNPLYDKLNESKIQYSLVLIYVDKNIHDYNMIESKIKLTLQRLVKEL